MITQEQINEVVRKIVENCNPQKIILFGSHANGTANENSDLDLIVVKDTDLPHHKRGTEVRKYLFGMKIPIDLLVFTGDEINEQSNDKYSFLYKALRINNVLYEKT